MPTPSFILPSAPVYEEGTLYGLELYGSNFVPSPMSFTRATTATRVNADGLVELVPYNLVTYSEQFDNASWIKNNGALAINSTTAPDGTITADKFTPNTSNAQHVISQAATLSASTTYTLSLYIKPDGYNTFAIRMGADAIWSGGLAPTVTFDTVTMTAAITTGIPTYTFTNVGDGWYRCSITATTSTGGSSGPGFYPNQYFPFAGDGTSGVFVWGAQLVEGTEALPYLKTETRLNRPRVDFSLPGCPNLLLEPQRTNLALYSEEFDNASWVKTNSTVTSNAIISPSGVQDADKLIDDAVNSFHTIRQSYAATINTTYIFTCFIKKAELEYANISSGGSALTGAGGSGADLIASVNLTNGNIVTNNNSIAVVPYDNGWYRVSIKLTTDNDGGNIVPYVGTSLNGITTSYIGTGQGIYIWGAQLEVGSYATSYIPTTATSVTRNYDIPSLTNIYTSGKLSASGGTWFTHLVNNVPRTRDSGGGVGLRLSNVAGNNSLHISTPSGSNQRYWIRKIVGGANTDLYNTLTDEIKVAIKWNGSTADVFVNGVKVVAATAFTNVDLENINVNNGNIPYYISSMYLYPTQLTDDELEALTGEGFNTYAEMASYYNYTLQ